MNETGAARFIFPQTLNERSGPVGLPTDETLAVFCPHGVGLLYGTICNRPDHVRHTLDGIKTFQKGKGSTWLFNLCYWSFPSILSKADTN